MTNIKQKEWGVLLFILVAIIWLYRALVLSYLKVDLYIDEAYYYNWAKHLDFGYYSKPPMLSLLIAFSTKLFGDSVTAIKFGAELVYPITTYFVYLIAKELFNARIAFYSALTFFTIPSIWLSSMIISTDVVLLLFWAMALYFFIKAVREDRWYYWVFAGVSSGFGLLSKYNFVFFLVSVVLTFILIPNYRKYFKSRYFYLAMLIAVVIFLPNLWWNYKHDFISFVHTKQISHIESSLIHPSKFFEFFGAQFLVFGPILFGAFWVIVFKREFLKDERYLVLFLFSIVMLGFIMMLSFLSRSFANWAAPTYVAATILVVAYLVLNKKTWLVWLSIILHSLLGVVFYNYHQITDSFGIELHKKNDPYNRVLGWSEVIRKVGDVWKTKYSDTTLLARGRGDVAEADYYLSTKTSIFNPHHEMENQYHMDRDLNEKKGEDFLLFQDDKNVDDLLPYFESVEFVKRVDAKIYRDFNRTYYLFHCVGFKGY